MTSGAGVGFAGSGVLGEVWAGVRAPPKEAKGLTLAVGVAAGEGVDLKGAGVGVLGGAVGTAEIVSRGFGAMTPSTGAWGAAGFAGVIESKEIF